MSRTRPPSYRFHKPSGQAVTTLRTPDGKRKDLYLGAWKSKESKAAYGRVLAELVSTPTAAHFASTPGDRPSVNEVLVAFLRHAQLHYRHRDGTTTSEYENYVLTIRPLRKLYGFTHAAEFGKRQLKTVRDAMVVDGLSRKVVNQRVGRIVRIFRWAAEADLVTESVFADLALVRPLQANRSAAPETDEVKPVADDVVAATLHFVPRPVAGLIRFQDLTGSRPGEAMTLRRCDIVDVGPVWVYRPIHHKLSHKRMDRAIVLGPRVQALLAEFPTATPNDFVFAPARANSGPRYNRWTYSTAIARGVKQANARRERLAGEGNYDPVPHWHANQLRHSFATKVRKMYGLEAVQVALGHARADVTQLYAERNLALAAEVAAKVG